jgi:hypothetical protein
MWGVRLPPASREVPHLEVRGEDVHFPRVERRRWVWTKIHLLPLPSRVLWGGEGGAEIFLGDYVAKCNFVKFDHFMSFMPCTIGEGGREGGRGEGGREEREGGEGRRREGGRGGEGGKERGQL